MHALQKYVTSLLPASADVHFICICLDMHLFGLWDMHLFEHAPVWTCMGLGHASVWTLGHASG